MVFYSIGHCTVLGLGVSIPGLIVGVVITDGTIFGGRCMVKNAWKLTVVLQPTRVPGAGFCELTRAPAAVTRLLLYGAKPAARMAFSASTTLIPTTLGT